MCIFLSPFPRLNASNSQVQRRGTTDLDEGIIAVVENVLQAWQDTQRQLPTEDLMFASLLCLSFDARFEKIDGSLCQRHLLLDHAFHTQHPISGTPNLSFVEDQLRQCVSFHPIAIGISFERTLQRRTMLRSDVAECCTW